MKKLLFLVPLLAIASTLMASDIEPAKLVLSAKATIYKPSDELQLKVGVVTLGKTAQATCADNNGKMEAVIEGLELAGLVKGDYETGHFSIQPTYTPYPKNPTPDWKPSINGYEVSNSILIHTDKMDLAGKIIDLANKAGANQISDICFGLKDPRIYWAEALGAAATNAVTDAKTLADATGVQLVRILSITLDNTRVHAPQVNAAYMSKSSGGEGSAPMIEPGEVTLTANVTLTYEIK